jgi:hypothetical protein
MAAGVSRRPVSHAAQLRRDARCLAALVVMRAALSTVGYAAIRARMPAAAPSEDGHFYARQLARRIERLARLVPGASCLTQALALQYLLARGGHACKIHVGVRGDAAGAFAAHAWVTCNGRIVLGAADTRLADFTPIAERS